MKFIDSILSDDIDIVDDDQLASEETVPPTDTGSAKILGVDAGLYKLDTRPKD